MSRAITLSIFIVLLAAGGCHLDQQKEVARYRKVLDADAPPIDFTPGAPLSLEQALALANQHNERLALRGEDYLQALIAKDRAASNFLPTIEQRRGLLLDAQAIVLLDVARTYYQVLRSERSVEVLKNSLNLQDERVRDFQARRRAGVVRPLDVAQTEAQASATRVSLIDARNDVVNGRTTLAFLVGAPVASSPLIDQADP